MLKSVISILLFLGLILSAQAQVVIQVNAGSRAAWGNNQNLMIDKNGKCTYFVSQPDGQKKDSKEFSISQKQLDGLFSKAESVGFFTLDAKYDGGVADGAGVFIAIKSGTKINSVDVFNKDVSAINSFVETLNVILKTQNIRIYYGQKSSN